MKIDRVGQSFSFRAMAVLAAVSIITSAATTLAQSPANDKSTKTGVMEKPASVSKPRITADTRTKNPAAQAGNTLGPPAPMAGAAARAPGKPANNIPEPTVALKPGELPKIDFDTPTYNFGRIQSGADVVHDFWFTNSGNGPLEILSVKPSCGCTTAGEYDRIVKPGDTGKIPIKVATKSIGGSVTKSIRIITNIPGSEPVSIKMSGEVWQVVEVNPRSVNFGRMTADQMEGREFVKRITVQNNVGESLNLTNLRSNNPAFRLESKVIEPGKKAEISVTLLTPLKDGNNYGRIEADTGVAEMPSLSFAASAYVMAEVEVTPPAITLQGKLDKTTKRFVTIRNSGKSPMKISEVTVSNPAITTELTETTPGTAFRVVLEIPAGTQLSGGGESVTIKTDNPRFAELNVSIQQRQLPVARHPAAATLQPGSGSPKAVGMTRATATPTVTRISQPPAGGTSSDK